MDYSMEIISISQNISELKQFVRKYKRGKHKLTRQDLRNHIEYVINNLEQLKKRCDYELSLTKMIYPSQNVI